MRTQLHVFGLVFALGLGLAQNAQGVDEVVAPDQAEQTGSVAESQGSAEGFQLFHLDDLIRARSESPRPYLPFFQNPNLRLGLYELDPGADDLQKPHAEDEIYYVLEGLATAVIRNERRQVRTGDILFIAAHEPHRFVEIREKLRLLVVFAGQP